MPNGLTRHVSLSAGTWLLETLVKHYFERLIKDRRGKAGVAEESGQLRRDDLLYDEVFHIIKSFLEVSAHHTIEELQQFSNTRTPSPPWVHVMRVRVPMSICDEAAGYLIDVLGGEEKTRQLVGGTKWWQVRGIRGVDAQWIVTKKDHERVKKQRKQSTRNLERNRQEASATSNEQEAVYDPEMDGLRCILYFHGGGYYFGSVDQERYFIQRFARKSGCRILAINYRLAPQYPFPCAIQDILASYLYLISPPPDAPHAPIKPENIIISGDSAGGGLTLALLQVVRDLNLPMPAGGIPISPWCDLTHSFPSITLNTDTDVISKYGLSIYKPSPLWPPPSDDLTDKVHASLRSRIKQAARQYRKNGQVEKEELAETPSFWRRKLSFGNRDRKHDAHRPSSRITSRNASAENLASHAKTGDVRAAAVSATLDRQRTGQSDKELHVGPTASLPMAHETSDQTLRVIAENGEKLEVPDQVHMYTINSLLDHPLVSPAMSYLGGLPPLLVIASDGEVLRDEIIYTAHKAAHPERYPVKPEARQLYPKLEGIEERFGPTKVHLQVYDYAAHTLPVLFFVCTPAKFCFRAMATFSKHLFGTLPKLPESNTSSTIRPSPRRLINRRSVSLSIPRRLSSMRSRRRLSSHSQRSDERQPENDQVLEPVTQVDSPDRLSESSSRSSTSNRGDAPIPVLERDMRFAGDPIVYQKPMDGSSSPFVDNMIRERVSTHGELRPLEPEDQLTACTVPQEKIGMASELVLRRFIEGTTKWDERFAKAKENIRKERIRNLKLAKKDIVRNISQLQTYFFQSAGEENEKENGEAVAGSPTVKEGLLQSASWSWAWALDGEERPPPSSIVARRDTEEARRLSRIADMPADTHDHRVSGNNLWSFLVNRLSLEKNVAQVEGRTVEDDPTGVGKDFPIDSAGQIGSVDESTSGNNVGQSQGRPHKPRWPRSLSRAATRANIHRDRGTIIRAKSASVTHVEPPASQADEKAS